MSELIHMSAEEVSGLLTEIESLLRQWDDDLSLLHTLGSALHQIWEAPAAADYIYEVHRILHGMEGEVEKLQYNHRLAQREFGEWAKADALPGGVHVEEGAIPLLEGAVLGRAVAKFAAAETGVRISLAPFPSLVGTLTRQGVSRMRWKDVFRLEGENSARLKELQSQQASLAEKEASLQRDLEAEENKLSRLEARKRELEEKLREVERQSKSFGNRILPDSPLRPGFDDGIIDMPWRTRSDALEDEATRLRQEIAQVDQSIAETKRRAASIQQHLEQIHQEQQRVNGQIRTVKDNLKLLDSRIDAGITDKPTRKDLITSRKYGLAGCTNYVAQKRDVTPFPNGAGHPGHPKDACFWDDQAAKAGYEVGTRPVKGSMMVFEKGVLGVDKHSGHVGYVEHVKKISGGYLVTTSEADTVVKGGVAVRGTHTPPHTRYYRMEPSPDGGYRIWRCDSAGHKHGVPVAIAGPHQKITFIYDRRK